MIARFGSAIAEARLTGNPEGNQAFTKTPPLTGRLTPVVPE